MQSKARSVDEYVQEADETRKPNLKALRDLCREVLAGYTEGMDYGMASYSLDGVGGVGFANQKHYISLYILKDEVVIANKPLLKGLSVGKCCIRFSSMKKMDFGVIRKILEDAIRSEQPPC
jgi:uncharacterized protein YdhG (YjbR/CyaY superfamily)